jgi:hypothetical protein
LIQSLAEVSIFIFSSMWEFAFDFMEFRSDCASAEKENSERAKMDSDFIRSSWLIFGKE